MTDTRLVRLTPAGWQTMKRLADKNGWTYRETLERAIDLAWEQERNGVGTALAMREEDANG